MAEEKFYVGIDGGGTKTEFVLSDSAGRVLRRLLKSGCNPNDIGLDSCFALLESGLGELLDGIPKERTFIFAGVSGAGIGDNADTLRLKLAAVYPNVLVASDLLNVLETCLKGSDGIAMICGTGISCCICENGERRTVGGYGHLFEDGGSGYAYGRDAVKAVLSYEDGIGESTVLTRRFYDRYPNGVRANLGAILHGGKALVASFCPWVFDGYYGGDGVCRQIVQNNLRYTEETLRAALRLQKQKGGVVAFIGGVTKETAFRERLQSSFGKENTLVFGVGNPIYGAVRRAVMLAGDMADERFENNFLKTLQQIGEKKC